MRALVLVLIFALGFAEEEAQPKPPLTKEETDKIMAEVLAKKKAREEAKAQEAPEAVDPDKAKRDEVTMRLAAEREAKAQEERIAAWKREASSYERKALAECKNAMAQAKAFWKRASAEGGNGGGETVFTSSLKLKSGATNQAVTSSVHHLQKFIENCNEYRAKAGLKPLNIKGGLVNWIKANGE